MRTTIPAWLLLLISLGTCTASFAQGWQWSRHFGGPGHDYGQIGAVDAAGNVYCFGMYAGPGPGNYNDLYIADDTLHGRKASFVTKHDAVGNLVWALNLTCMDQAHDIRTAALVLDTVDYSVIITGSYEASCHIGNLALQDSGAFLAKIDLNGNCLWADNIGSVKTAPKALLLNEGGELFVSGVIWEGVGSTIGDQVIVPGSFLAKYAVDGTMLWAKPVISGVTSSGYARFYPYTLRLHAGTVYVHGPCFPPAAEEPIIADTINTGVTSGADVLIGADEMTGTAKWVRAFGEGYGATYRYEDHMSIDHSGNVYCIGFAYFNDSIHFGSDTTVVVPSDGISYLVEYTPNGEFMHLHTYTTVGLEAIDVAVDGSVLLIGEAVAEPSSLDVCDIATGQGLFVARMDSAGNCMDMITTGYATGASVLQTPQAIYLTATTPLSTSLMPPGFPSTNRRAISSISLRCSRRAGNVVHLSATGTSSVHLGPGSHPFIHPCDGPGNSFHPKMVMTGTTNSMEEEEEEEKGEAELLAFPNPSTGLLTVRLREANQGQISNIRLFDGMGRLMLTQDMSGAQAMLNMHFPNGLYTLVVTHGSEENSARIILK